MKTIRWLALVILAAGLASLTACHRQKPPSPAIHAAVNISMSVNHGLYSDALNGLQALAGNPRLTAPQRTAVDALTDALNQLVAKAAAVAAAPKTP